MTARRTARLGPGGRRARVASGVVLFLASALLSGCLTSAGRFGSPVPVSVRTEVVTANGRALRTVVRTPDVAGPLPLVVFAHGYRSSPEAYAPLLDAWAAAGFEVAAPASPGLSVDAGPLDRAESWRQPGDLSAVITQLVAEGGIDSGRIAVAGHSDGGTNVARMALSPAFRDPRVAATLVLSGALPADRDGRGAGPMLVAVGDRDEYGNWPGTAGVYFASPAPRAFIRMERGSHLTSYVGGSVLGRAIRAATTDFLVAGLRYGPWDDFHLSANIGGLHLAQQGLF
jgi:poly(3-hydroxybutyrate) depolymerase